MEIKKVWAVAYSATGTTDRTVSTIAEELAAGLDVPLERVGFTRPSERTAVWEFEAGDLVVVGSPTYAGKLPNKILPDFRSSLHGNGALAVPVVLFGNRSYDNALAELAAVLETDGFHTVAAGAFVVGTGRSDFPNQINNVLVFPGVFRGALDVRAKDINDEMKIAAAHAIAELIPMEELRADYILPAAFDPRICPAVAAAVADAARRSGVARK